MATYHLTVHQLFERLSRDDSTISHNHHHANAPASQTTNDNKNPRKGVNGRSDSVISWLSTASSEADEIDFTDFNSHRNVEALERVVGEQKRR